MLGAAGKAAVEAAQVVGKSATGAAGKALGKAGDFAKAHPEEVYQAAKKAKEVVMGSSHGGGEPAVSARLSVTRWPAAEPAAAPDGWGLLQWAVVGVGLAAAVTAGVVAYRRWKGL
ncbi:uncharacterized protein LOC119306346 [Triticum dicoccoides]|uniref:uncharacterized protein LOC119306346 n=1 Tax=Triticum dicoccoides TaxID=85692 RepID=UPI00188E3B54|nr:uncharacterized protein LOC119306346 [Triticum dicoccoides]